MLLELYDCISFIGKIWFMLVFKSLIGLLDTYAEPTVSEVTQTKRAIRKNFGLGVDSLKSSIYLRANQMWHSKFFGNICMADSFKKAQEDVQYLNLRLKWWLAGLSTTQRNLLLLLLICLLSLLLYVLGFLTPYPDSPLTLRWYRNTSAPIDNS